MSPRDFSFAAHAKSFDRHIGLSIPGYGELIPQCAGFARRFVQSDTTVIDVGCSTGNLLAAIRRNVGNSRYGVNYVGIDSEPKFRSHWRKLETKDLQFKACEARSFEFGNISLACMAFTLQFIPPFLKLSLLQRLYSGLIEGGALIIAEKLLASTSRLQDALTFPYYDFKLKQHFSADEILAKERSLRGQMTLLTEAELRAFLKTVGFREIEFIWGRFPFLALLALK